MNDIQYIVFDFGGVIYDIDWNNTIERLRVVKGADTINYDLISSMISNSRTVHDHEKGLISTQEFRLKLCHELNIVLSDREFDSIWNATLIGLNRESVNMIKSIKEKYPLALLSNTNELHYDFFKPECSEILNYFNHTFFSHLIGMRKPDAAIYHFVAKYIGVETNQILFIDDVESNISGAKEAGCRVFHFAGDNCRENLMQFINI